MVIYLQQGNKDDTAADWIKFMCRDMSTTELLPDEEISVHPGHGRFGEYGSWSHYCTEGMKLIHKIIPVHVFTF